MLHVSNWGLCYLNHAHHILRPPSHHMMSHSALNVTAGSASKKTNYKLYNICTLSRTFWFMQFFSMGPSISIMLLCREWSYGLLASPSHLWSWERQQLNRPACVQHQSHHSCSARNWAAAWLSLSLADRWESMPRAAKALDPRVVWHCQENF